MIARLALVMGRFSCRPGPSSNLVPIRSARAAGLSDNLEVAEVTLASQQNQIHSACADLFRAAAVVYHALPRRCRAVCWVRQT